MAPHSSTLAWKIPWTEEPGRLQSLGSLRVRHNRATALSLFTFMHWRRKWQPTRVLAWRIPRTGEPGGLPSMGSHWVKHDWRDLAAAAAAALAYRNREISCKKLLACIEKIRMGNTELSSSHYTIIPPLDGTYTLQFAVFFTIPNGSPHV